MPLDGLILSIGGQTFTFKSCEVTSGVRTGYILDGSGSTWTAIFSDILGESNLFGEDFGFRQGIYLDLGGGEHIVELEATGWEGSNLPFGGVGGQDPSTQMNVLENVLVETQIDSVSPATIEFGEYSSGGMFSPLNVVVEGPRITRSQRSPSTFDIEMVFIETASFESGVFADALRMTG